MRLWRLTDARFTALDGSGPQLHGSRYSAPGRPVVNFASEAGLAVLVALRYLPHDLAGIRQKFVLGWTEVDTVPIRSPDGLTEAGIREKVDRWLSTSRSLLFAVRSKVLPEGDVVMLNPLHTDAHTVPPLTMRPFDFAQCQHRPPMLDIYGES